MKDRSVQYFLAIGVPLLLLGMLGQEMNPFATDNGFPDREYLFLRTPLASNYTPIALPAFIYGAVHAVASALGLALEQELRLASLLLNVLQFLASGCVMLACRDLGWPRFGIVAGIGILIFTQSLYMAQVMMSEPIVYPFVAAATYLTVRLFARPPRSAAMTVGSAVLAGCLIGLLTITRIVPGLFLPAMLFLALFSFSTRRALLFQTGALAAFLAIVTGQMSANQYRFGRFELSSSTGLHLWNGISPIADTLLADSADYQVLKRHAGGAQGKIWAELCRAMRPGAMCAHAAIKRVALEGVAAHPFLFAAQGLRAYRAVAAEPPDRFGLSIPSRLDGNRNPLDREEYLPPLVEPLGGFARLLDVVYAFGSRLYPLLLLVSLWLSLVTAAAPVAHWLAFGSLPGPRWQVGAHLALAHLLFGALAAWMLLWTGPGRLIFGAGFFAYPALLAFQPQTLAGSAARILAGMRRHAPLAAALAFVFVGAGFVTSASEEPVLRYKAIYLPLLGMMACLGAMPLAAALEKSSDPAGSASGSG